LQEATEADETLTSGAWSPPVDLCESVDAIQVRVELPGVTADQIRIGLTTDKLRISGEKKRRIGRRRIISHLCSERSYGHFNRLVPLRWTISVRDASARLANGVLLIRLPKIQDRRGAEYKIAIESEHAPSDPGAGKL